MAESSSSGLIGPQRQKGKRIVVNKYTRHACAQCKKAKTKCEGGEPVCDRCLKTGHDCVWVEDNRKALTRHHEQALRHQNGVLKSEVDQLKNELAAIKAQLGTLNLKTESGASMPPPPPVETATTGVHVSASPASVPDMVRKVPDDGGSGGVTSSSEDNRGGLRAAPRMKVTTIEDAEAYYTDISDREGDLAGGSGGSGLDGDGDVEIPTHDQHVSWKDLGVPSGVGAQESDDDSDENSDDGSSSDSNYYDSSDLDGDDAVGMNRLVQPSKRLFVEYDDLHLYGLTSVFRLRQENRRRRHHGHHAQDSSRHGGGGGGGDHDPHHQIRRRPSERTVRSRSRRQSFGASAVVGFKLAHQAAERVGDESSDGFVYVPVVRRSSKSREKSAMRGERGSAWEREKEKGRKEKGRKARKKTRSGASTQRAPSQSTSPSRADLAHQTSVKKHVLLLSSPQTESLSASSSSSSSPLTASTSTVPVTKEDATSESRTQCECWATCWARFLPPEVMEVMGRVEHDVLVDRTFIFFSSWCMRVVPEYFLRDMYATLHSVPPPRAVQEGSTGGASQSSRSPALTTAPKKAHYSPFLHNALLAVATAFSDDPRISSSQANASPPPTSNVLPTESKSKEISSIRFLLAERAKSYIESECARPSVSAVQALSMLASVYSGMGEQTLGFMYFGMSARISQALGLNADYGSLLRTGRIRPREVFDRMWCYHMGASQDACWSLYVGREFGIPMGDDDDPSILEGLVDPMLDTMGWRQENRGTGESQDGEEVVALIPQRCGTFSVFLWSCYLMKVSRRIMDLMNRLGKTEGGNGTEIKLLVADIDIQLIAWREDLPQDLKLNPSNEGTALPHKLMMHLAYWWLLILLHRPFYRRRGVAAMDLTFSVNRCDLAAREILSLLRLWKRIYGTIRFTPITMIQIAFASGTIYIMAAIQAGTGRRPASAKQADALDRVKEIIELLKEMGSSWNAATKIAGVFGRLVGEVERGIEAKNVGKRERKRRRTKTVTEATTPKLTAAKAETQAPTEMSIDSATDSDLFGDMPVSTDPLSFLSQQANVTFSPSVDAAPYAISPESDSPVSFTHLQSGGSGGDMSSASDSESGFLDFHPTSDSQYDLIHLYNSFMQNNMDNMDFSGMDIDVSNLPGMSFGPNPGTSQGFNFVNGMTDGNAFATQPFVPSFDAQALGDMGFAETSGFGNVGGVHYDSFAGYGGLWNGMAPGNVAEPGSTNQQIHRARSNTGSVSFDLNELTSDGEDRALRDVISQLGSEYAQRSPP